eukprot:873386-Lingulodinium_polyedra.AAC.1
MRGPRADRLMPPVAAARSGQKTNCRGPVKCGRTNAEVHGGVGDPGSRPAVGANAAPAQGHEMISCLRNPSQRLMIQEHKKDQPTGQTNPQHIPMMRAIA